MALFLALWDRAKPGFLTRCLEKHPTLNDTYRFYIDTWCLNRYYPLIGDTGGFAEPYRHYAGVRFQRPGIDSVYSHKDAALQPSMFTFMWNLYRLTGDAAFVQVMATANDNVVDGLPHDPFIDHADSLQHDIAAVLAENGSDITVPAVVNKEQWQLAVLRSGSGENARAAWLNYGVGGGHNHHDAMNLGLFAYGLDLMPELGYPPVQYGGWASPRALWYRSSAAHNTMVIDGQDHPVVTGRTTLLADGKHFRAVRAEADDVVPLISAVPDKRPLGDPWRFMWDAGPYGHRTTLACC